jgi:hypothetical protein
MRNRRVWLRTAGMAAVVVLAFGWAAPASAAPCAMCKTTFLFLPLSGVFQQGRQRTTAPDTQSRARQRWETATVVDDLGGGM